MKEAVECVCPGTTVIFEWGGSNHNVEKVVSPDDYANSKSTKTKGIVGLFL